MSDREALYKAVLGPKNQAYYLQHFARFDAAGKAGPSWNWAAATFTFIWFLYRRMWPATLAYIVLANVLSAIFAVLFGEMGNLLALIAQVVLPGMFANALYHRHCNKRIAAAEAGNDLQGQLTELSKNGGTSRSAAIAITALFGIAILGMLAAIAIPEYQDYTNRAKLAEAAKLGRQAVESVEAYRQQHQQLPVALAEAGFAAKLPPFVYGVEIDHQAIVVTIRQGGGFPDGGSLTWTASVDAAGKAGWACTGRRIAETILPTECR
ncbi:DUF2628 domain-containing protein [Dokdonella sp.]|uniref:DUF2628 domain-containing protein n=1 Tax=Dokdonella sp. TaxID=2291710 RepID=UPI002DD646F1|nr:DUF2628 domain-containing protein [Dokdonella sp.]